MRKLLLFALTLSIGLSVNAQEKKKAPVIPSKLAKQSVLIKKITHNDEQAAASNQFVPLKPKSPLSLNVTRLGYSEYDLQTNSSVQNRLVKHPDGTFSAAWTMSLESPPSGSFADRGTGYAYFDGTSWTPYPTARIENVRTGWPSMTVANGKEVVIAHNNSGLTMSTRTKGTGSWTTAAIPFSSTHTLSWPRAMGAGLNSQTIHLIATDFAGSTANGMLYSRSTDGGATWDIQDSVLPGMNPVTEMLPTGGDDYVIDVKGDTLGIVTGDMTTDVVLIKSFDGGTTWSKQTVWKHQIPLWNTSIVGGAGTSDANGDGAPDTLTTTDGNYALVIDRNGVFHVFMSVIKILRDSTAQANYFSSFYMTDGVVYWNSTQPTIVPGISYYADTVLNKVGYVVDINGNGILDYNYAASGTKPFGDYGFMSVSSMANAAIDANNNIYCTYSSVVEGTTDTGDTLGKGFRNIYAIRSTDGGTTWSDPKNITKDDWAECTYGSMARTVDNHLYMEYQSSSQPGIFLTDITAANPHQEQLNNINFVTVKNDLSDAGINEASKTNISVSQNYPNPFNGSTNIKVNLDKASTVSISVVNLIGQEVYRADKGTLSAGNHIFTIEGSDFTSGIYFYTVKAGTRSVTNKMIVE